MEGKTRHVILVYGLNANQIGMMMRELSEHDYRYAKCWQDVIAIPADLVIVNPKKVSAEGLEVLAQFYKEIEPSPERLILSEPCEILEKISNVEYIENLFEEPYRIRTVALRCLHETVKDVDYSRKLVLGLTIMRFICKYPGITTKEISEITELSQRSVKRYIDALRTAGADIDFEGKGWHCKIALWDY